MWLRVLFLTFFGCVGSVSSWAQASELRVVDSIDLARYAGRWYEIVRAENRFQKACAGEVTAHYSLRPDGRIDVTNECFQADGDLMSASGVARTPDPAQSSKLEVRFAPSWLSFLPMVWGDYWVMDLADDYTWAVVGEPSRRYFWVLSRTPKLDEAVLAGILERTAGQGYDTANLVRTRQLSYPR